MAMSVQTRLREEDESEDCDIDLSKVRRIDQICTYCGIWQSEHDYEVCLQPKWLQNSDPLY